MTAPLRTATLESVLAVPRGGGGGGPTWLVAIILVIIIGAFVYRFLRR
jgi:hypothetical protein